MRGLLPFVFVVSGCATPPRPAPAPAQPSVPTPPAAPASAGDAEPRLPPQPPGHLTSSRIAALPDGALVIDADSGRLVRTEDSGAIRTSLPIGVGAGTLAVDVTGEVAYVADRRGDRIVVCDIRGALWERASWKTPVEPFGVALAPDASTLYVTAGADRALVAYDTRNGTERWRARLPAEPRAIAISPDGSRALVTTAATGTLLDVSLATRAVSEIAFDTTCDRCVDGPPFARGAAVMFIDAHRAIASFQREVPRAIELFSSEADRYGGTLRTPITQHLAFLTFDSAGPPTQVVAQIFANQPRSLSWDALRDVLYVGGVSSDQFVALPGLTSGSNDKVEDDTSLFRLPASEACGPDGISRGDGIVFVWCSLSRRVIAYTADTIREGPPVAATVMSPQAHAGFVLFHSGRSEINRASAITCATCHPEGRADGLSWMIQSANLQTPVLAGRVAHTAPYKWTGSDATLEHSVRSTVKRLGGNGLAAKQIASLVAYVESMPAPRTPTLDRAAVERGKHVFESWDCGDCHHGPRFTDGQKHTFFNVLDSYETPSLLGIAASAPYYHDGSAPTLEALLRGEGRVKGMSDLARLSDEQRADLAAYLSSL